MRHQLSIGQKCVTLFSAPCEAPLLVLNQFSRDGADVWAACQSQREMFHLLCVSDIDWNRDMTPWSAPALSPQEPPFTGGADQYLKCLTEKILPAALEIIKPTRIGICGYSLAGLFAVYAMYRSDVFSCAASVSGSMWYPGFVDFCESHSLQRTPDALYFSLGSRESKTRNPALSRGQICTETLVSHFESLGVPVRWELNPGNHFTDAAGRCAKAISFLCAGGR